MSESDTQEPRRLSHTGAPVGRPAEYPEDEALVREVSAMIARGLTWPIALASLPDKKTRDRIRAKAKKRLLEIMVRHREQGKNPRMRNAQHQEKPSATPFADAYAELTPKITELRAEYADVVAQRLARQRFEEKDVSIDPQRDRQDAALAKLYNGSAPKPKKRETFAQLLERQAVLERAIGLATKLHEELRLQMLAERSEAVAGDFVAAERERVQALLAYEHATQKSEALARDTNLQPMQMPTLGHLRNTASRLYDFCDRASRLGYLPPKDLEVAYAVARKAEDQ